VQQLTNFIWHRASAIAEFLVLHKLLP